VKMGAVKERKHINLKRYFKPTNKQFFGFSIILVVLLYISGCGIGNDSPPEDSQFDSSSKTMFSSNESNYEDDDDNDREHDEKDDDDSSRSSADEDSSSDNDNSSRSILFVKKAKWDEEDKELKVKGTGKSRDTVILYDASNSNQISSTTIDSDGEWEFEIEDFNTPPCKLRLESNGDVLFTFIDGITRNCDAVVIGDNDTPTPEPNPTPNPQPTPTQVSGNVQVLGFNDLGMHCMDDDYSVFSVLPPFNVLHAQVIQKGTRNQNPVILDASQVDVQYSATSDPSGSINSTSIGKTNFWEYVQGLFAMSPAPDEGLLGVKMPSAENGPQSFHEYNPNQQWFSADGIPITPTDDAGNYNPYPLMQVSAIDKASGATLSNLDVTVPVSTEMNCDICHNTGNVAADSATANKYSNTTFDWSSNQNPVLQYKENVLILHDAKHNTNLVNNTPVLCADCHYSPALDLAGAGPQGNQIGKTLMSHAVHGRHGMNIDGTMPSPSNPAIISDEGKTACYNCHPGKQTQCFRGVMFSAGLDCQSCHGGLLAVAGTFPLADGSTRQPWQDLPKCQSCHTGDAVDHMGNEIILKSAFQAGDNSAQAIVASNKRFAEQGDALYRNSRGHGGVSCEACHGSTHAVWPVSDAIGTNDNLTAVQLQGHAGFISECSVCHEAGSLPLTLNGPHGMHNVGDSRWNEDHDKFFERDPNSCKTCHGNLLEGTVLSKLSKDRVLKTDDSGNVQFAKGTEIACDLCHKMP